MPLRRTFLYLRRGKIHFRDNVQVFSFGYNRCPSEAQKGAREFVFWHWAQLQYHNPKVQLGRSREEIVEMLQGTLGKTELVRKREHLEQIFQRNPASFGSQCERQCMCEVQGQHPCTSLLHAPQYLRGKWRWNHNIL
uniref:Ribosomal protein/NADH dehydrogenase domain-containing protein n=1 Tax=Parascaris equorum TaxID=6256 RepID=A0A914S825_PAREQ